MVSGTSERSLVSSLMDLSRLLYRTAQIVRIPSEDLLKSLGLELPLPPQLILCGIQSAAATFRLPPSSKTDTIQRHEVLLDGHLVGELPHNAETFQLLNLYPSVRYELRIIAVNHCDLRAVSKSVTFQTLSDSLDLFSGPTQATIHVQLLPPVRERPTLPKSDGCTLSSQSRADPTPLSSHSNSTGEPQLPAQKPEGPSTHSSCEETVVLGSLPCNGGHTRDLHELRSDLYESIKHFEKVRTEYQATLDTLEQELSAVRNQAKTKEDLSSETRRELAHLERNTRILKNTRDALEKKAADCDSGKHRQEDEIRQWKEQLREIETEMKTLEKEKGKTKGRGEKRMKSVKENVKSLQKQLKSLEQELKQYKGSLPPPVDEQNPGHSEPISNHLEEQRHLLELRSQVERETCRLQEVRDLRDQAQRLLQHRQAQVRTVSGTDIFGFHQPAGKLGNRGDTSGQAFSYTHSHDLNDHHESSRGILSPTAQVLLPSGLLGDEDSPQEMRDSRWNPDDILESFRGHQSARTTLQNSISSTQSVIPSSIPKSPTSSNSRSTPPSVWSSPRNSSLQITGFPTLHDSLKQDSDALSIGSAALVDASTTVEEPVGSRKLASFFSWQRGRNPREDQLRFGSLRPNETKSVPRSHEFPDPIGTKRRSGSTASWVSPASLRGKPTLGFGRADGSTLSPYDHSASSTLAKRRLGFGMFGAGNQRPTPVAGLAHPGSFQVLMTTSGLPPPRPSTESQPFGWPSSHHQDENADISRIYWSLPTSRRQSLRNASTSSSGLGFSALAIDDLLKVSENMPSQGTAPPVPKLNPAAAAFTSKRWTFRNGDAKKKAKDAQSSTMYDPDPSPQPDVHDAVSVHTISSRADTATTASNSIELSLTNASDSIPGTPVKDLGNSFISKLVTRKSSSGKFNLALGRAKDRSSVAAGAETPTSSTTKSIFGRKSAEPVDESAVRVAGELAKASLAMQEYSEAAAAAKKQESGAGSETNGSAGKRASGLDWVRMVGKSKKKRDAAETAGVAAEDESAG